MRTILVAVLLSLLQFLTIGDANAIGKLPGATLEPAGVTTTQDGMLSVTVRLGEAICRNGSVYLNTPTIRWPNGKITNQTLFENYGYQSGDTVTIGPYQSGTNIEFEIQPEGFVCDGEFYLSTDPFHARIVQRGQDKWTISWEDYNDGDFNDLYLDVEVEPKEIFWFSPIFVEEIIAKVSPFSVNPHYKLPWPKGERHEVSQVPGNGEHGGANAYDFRESFTVTAPESGVVLWVEDAFEDGGNDRSLLSSTNVIVLQTTQDTQVTFVHLKKSSAKVKVGDRVSQGQVLATSGNSGFTILSSHLHLEFQHACHTLAEVRQLRSKIPSGTPTFAWACPTKTYFSDGFYIGDRFYAKLSVGSSYTSDNH